MNPVNYRNNPEEIIQNDIRKMLEQRGWLVLRVVGNAYQSGFPDLYATHKDHGGRWIEVKLPGMRGSRFTRAQLSKFGKLEANGTQVFILTGATVSEYSKLFHTRDGKLESNLLEYLLK